MTTLPSFGQLRSMLHASLAARPDREALLGLLLERHGHDPRAYHDQWLPYLQSFSHKLPDPFGTVTTLGQAEIAAALLPGARFRLSLSGQPPKTALALPGDPRLRHISALCLYRLDLTDDALTALLEDPHLERLLELDLGANSKLTLAPILGSSKLSDLEVLDLHRCYIWNGTRALQHTPNMPSLRVLDLGGENLTQEMSAALRTNFPRLQHLY